MQYDVALFDTEVRDELIPFEVPGGNGRTYYRNAGRTRREGPRSQLATDVGPVSLDDGVRALAFPLSRFREWHDAVRRQHDPRHSRAAGAGARRRGTSAMRICSPRCMAKSRVFVNDANTPAACAGVFAVVRIARVGRDSAAFGTARGSSPVVGVQNLFDRHYVGSVAVNAAGRDAGRDEVLRAGAGSHVVHRTQRGNESLVAASARRA